jgi:hypothetical protein
LYALLDIIKIRESMRMNWKGPELRAEFSAKNLKGGRIILKSVLKK